MNDVRLRGKSQAIQHNSALPKAGQSLRRASLGGLPLRALRVRVMVCYVLRPFAAHPAILRVRAFTAWRTGVASLRALGASLSGSPVAKAPSRQRRLLPGVGVSRSAKYKFCAVLNLTQSLE
jgi:hypothetical protein